MKVQESLDLEAPEVQGCLDVEVEAPEEVHGCLDAEAPEAPEVHGGLDAEVETPA